MDADFSTPNDANRDAILTARRLGVPINEFRLWIGLREPSIPCAFSDCGKEFTPTRAGHIFCSDDCRAAHHYTPVQRPTQKDLNDVLKELRRDKFLSILDGRESGHVRAVRTLTPGKLVSPVGTVEEIEAIFFHGTTSCWTDAVEQTF